jgi:chromate transporter
VTRHQSANFVPVARPRRAHPSFREAFLYWLKLCFISFGGPAGQLAIYSGWLLHRTWSGIDADTLFVLPSLLILGALTYIYLAFGDISFMQGIFNGIKPAVVAIVVFAAWRIGSRALKHRLLWALAAAAFVARQWRC